VEEIIMAVKIILEGIGVWNADCNKKQQKEIEV
jgi:hypothetical protein